MGAAGAGKTTVGRALAKRLGWRFVDADDLHSPANVAKMTRGIPLDDADRTPWLAQVHAVMTDAADRSEDLVVACSALRERYRSDLAEGVRPLRWVFLQAPRALLHERLSLRRGHFAGPELLDAQLAALEPPIDAMTIDAGQPVLTVVDAIWRWLRRTDDSSA